MHLAESISFLVNKLIISELFFFFKDNIITHDHTRIFFFSIMLNVICQYSGNSDWNSDAVTVSGDILASYSFSFLMY